MGSPPTAPHSGPALSPAQTNRKCQAVPPPTPPTPIPPPPAGRGKALPEALVPQHQPSLSGAPGLSVQHDPGQDCLLLGPQFPPP